MSAADTTPWWQRRQKTPTQEPRSASSQGRPRSAGRGNTSTNQRSLLAMFGADTPTRASTQASSTGAGDEEAGSTKLNIAKVNAPSSATKTTKSKRKPRSTKSPRAVSAKKAPAASKAKQSAKSPKNAKKQRKPAKKCEESESDDEIVVEESEYEAEADEAICESDDEEDTASRETVETKSDEAKSDDTKEEEAKDEEDMQPRRRLPRRACRSKPIPPVPPIDVDDIDEAEPPAKRRKVLSSKKKLKAKANGKSRNSAKKNARQVTLFGQKSAEKEAKKRARRGSGKKNNKSVITLSSDSEVEIIEPPVKKLSALERFRLERQKQEQQRRAMYESSQNSQTVDSRAFGALFVKQKMPKMRRQSSAPMHCNMEPYMVRGGTPFPPASDQERIRVLRFYERLGQVETREIKAQSENLRLQRPAPVVLPQVSLSVTPVELPDDTNDKVGVAASLLGVPPDSLRAEYDALAGGKEHDLWAERYRPRRPCDLLGNRSVRTQFESWLASFCSRSARRSYRRRYLQNADAFALEHELDAEDMIDSDSDFEYGQADDAFPNVLVLSGPRGSGKSSLVSACAAAHKLQLIEVNAAHARDGASLRALLSTALRSQSVVDDTAASQKAEKSASFFAPSQPKAVPKNAKTKEKTAKAKKRNRKMRDDEDSDFDIGERRRNRNGADDGTDRTAHSSKSVIVMEDIDSECLFQCDSGFVSALRHFMKTTRRPIVLLSQCDTVLLQRIARTVRESITQLDLSHPHDCDIRTQALRRLLLIVLRQGVLPVTGSLTALLEGMLSHTQGDLPRCLHALQFWLQSYADIDTDDTDTERRCTRHVSLSTLLQRRFAPVDDVRVTVSVPCACQGQHCRESPQPSFDSVVQAQEDEIVHPSMTTGTHSVVFNSVATGSLDSTWSDVVSRCDTLRLALFKHTEFDDSSCPCGDDHVCFASDLTNTVATRQVMLRRGRQLVDDLLIQAARCSPSLQWRHREAPSARGYFLRALYDSWDILRVRGFCSSTGFVCDYVDMLCSVCHSENRRLERERNSGERMSRGGRRLSMRRARVHTEDHRLRDRLTMKSGRRNILPEDAKCITDFADSVLSRRVAPFFLLPPAAAAAAAPEDTTETTGTETAGTAARSLDAEEFANDPRFNSS
ncbi:MAG: hypothetical protein MHM6MM_000625 [Cercozoa sp. M6MM]